MQGSGGRTSGDGATPKALSLYVLLAAAGLAAAAFLVLVERAALNRAELAAESARLRGAVAARLDAMVVGLESETRAAAQPQLYDIVFNVVDGTGTAVTGPVLQPYAAFAAWIDAARAKAGARQATSLRGSMDIATGNTAQDKRSTVAFVTAGPGQAWLVAARDVAPSGSVRVGVHKLSATVLAELAATAGVNTVRLGNAGGTGQLALESPASGRVDAQLDWTANRPGDAFAANTGTALVLLAALLTGFLALALRRMAHARSMPVSAADSASAQAVPPAPNDALPASPDAGLAEALAANRLYVAYQPVVSGDATRMVAAQAQLCWQHPLRGLLRDGQLLTPDTDPGLVVLLGHYLLRQAMANAASWPGLRLSVPIHADLLCSPDFVSRLRRCLAETGFPAGRLECVLSPVAAGADRPLTGAILAELRALGVQLALSDAGDGLTGLLALRLWPVQRLQLDAATLHAFGSEGEHVLHTAAVVQFAAGLGVAISARGVDTLARQQFLRAAGCDELSGAHFAGAQRAEIMARLAGEGTAASVALTRKVA